MKDSTSKRQHSLGKVDTQFIGQNSKEPGIDKRFKKQGEMQSVTHFKGHKKPGLVVAILEVFESLGQENFKFRSLESYSMSSTPVWAIYSPAGLAFNSQH